MIPYATTQANAGESSRRLGREFQKGTIANLTNETKQRPMEEKQGYAIPREQNAKSSNECHNTGSVGQPRDIDPRAKYVIWNNCLQTLKIRRMAYGIALTASKIMTRGFLRRDADRLWKGE